MIQEKAKNWQWSQAHNQSKHKSTLEEFAIIQDLKECSQIIFWRKWAAHSHVGDKELRQNPVEITENRKSGKTSDTRIIRHRLHNDYDYTIKVKHENRSR